MRLPPMRLPPMRLPPMRLPPMRLPPVRPPPVRLPRATVLPAGIPARGKHKGHPERMPFVLSAGDAAA